MREIISLIERRGDEETLNAEFFETLKESKLHVFPELAAVLNELLRHHEGVK